MGEIKTNEIIVENLIKNSGLTSIQIARLFGTTIRSIQGWVAGSPLTERQNEILWIQLV